MYELFKASKADALTANCMKKKRKSITPLLNIQFSYAPKTFERIKSTMVENQKIQQGVHVRRKINTNEVYNLFSAVTDQNT